MTAVLEFRSLRIHTHAGEEATYTFSSRLNLVVGPFGSGKTSLLELLKYGIGGGAELSQTVEHEVSAAVVECRIGNATWRFRRAIGSPVVEVFDVEGILETTLHVRGAGKRGRPSAWLLEALGVPPLRVRRAKRAKSGTSEAVSFFDLYAFAYLPQAEIDRSVVGHRDRDRNRKRKAVFEFMFGLTDEELSDLEVREGRLAEKAQQSQRDAVAIQRFLEQASTPPRESLRTVIETATSEYGNARFRLDQLRTEASAAAAQVAERRDEVQALRSAAQDARARRLALETQIGERRQLEANLTLDLERLSRSESAASALSGLEFTRCPRCLQSVESQRVEPGHCYVCGQVELHTDEPARDDAEISRLQTLRREIRALLASDEDERRSVQFELELLEEQLQMQEAVLAQSDAPAVSPLFDAIATSSAQMGDAENRRRRAEELLHYWNELDELGHRLQELQNERSELLREISEVRARLEERRSLVVEFSDTFAEVVSEARLPWFKSAAIDLETYLPLINGGSFGALSSGGMKAVINVAYHLALLTEGLVERDLQVPSLLIIDSPAKNLGVSKNDRSQADRVYRRIAALVGAHEQRQFQIIVADNDPPGVPVPVANTIVLSYESPLVPGVEHPGPDVPTIGDDSESSSRS